jgi:release factor glutamine methyltransferase
LTIQEVLEKGVKELKNFSISSPLRYAQLLLSFSLKKDILYLITNNTKILDIKISNTFFDYIKRASNNEPLEYITNTVSFYSKDFFVDKNVLIPRPESEILINKALKYINNENNKIAEIGVGSGILSITLASILKNATFIATDISKDAIKIASKNAFFHKVDNKISFIHTSLLNNISEDIDIIISNPPYIKNSYQLDKNILFEPKIALFGGIDGDEILKNIIDLAYKKEVQLLICEMGYDQKEPISTYINNKYTYDKLEFYKDLAGFDRGFVLKIRNKKDNK